MVYILAHNVIIARTRLACARTHQFVSFALGAAVAAAAKNGGGGGELSRNDCFSERVAVTRWCWSRACARSSNSKIIDSAAHNQKNNISTPVPVE